MSAPSKQVLRKAIANTLKSLNNAELVRQSEQAAALLRQRVEYLESRSIAFYMHMATGELQTSTMIANAFDDGKRVFLPHIVPYAAGETHDWFPTQKTHLRMLELPSMASVMELEPVGKFKLKEPSTGLDCLSEEGPGLDLIVLPGVGFSKKCTRLGHGAGFYDSFVTEHERVKHKTPKLIGVGFKEQLVEPASVLPLAPHDRTLDCVILGDTVYNITE